MAAPRWNLGELCGLLNVCNSQSVGLIIKVSLMKLELHQFPPDAYFKVYVEYSSTVHDIIKLSDDHHDIWEFLGVPFLNMDHHFDSHDDVFDIVVRHRFFHISKMTMGLGLLQIPRVSLPAGYQKSYQILDEFMAWWYRGGNLSIDLRDSRCFTYDEVIWEFLKFFGAGKKVFTKWEMLMIEQAKKISQWHIDEYRRPSISGSPPLRPGSTPATAR